MLSLDEGMLQKVQDLLLKLPKDDRPRARSLASDVPTSDAESLKAQQLNAEVGTKVAEARRLMETDPEKAIALLQTTLASVKAAEMPQTVARTMTRRLEVAIELAKKDKVAFDAKMLDKNAKAEIETKKLRILEADKAKKGAVNDLMTKAQEAQAKGDWAKAEELAQRAGEIDPDDIGRARCWPSRPTSSGTTRPTSCNKQDKEEGFLNEMQDVDEAMVIDTDASRNGIAYPKNFQEMSERRRKMQLSDSRQRTVQELAIEKKLNEPITLNLQDQTLDEADQVHLELHRPERDRRPQGPQRRGAEPRLEGQPDRQQHQAQERPEVHAPPARPDLQGRGRRPADHQPAGVPRQDLHLDLPGGRPGRAAQHGADPGRPGASGYPDRRARTTRATDGPGQRRMQGTGGNTDRQGQPEDRSPSPT